MALITVAFPKKEKPFYIKAIVEESEKDFFIKKGAKLTYAEAIEKPKPKAMAKGKKDASK